MKIIIAGYGKMGHEIERIALIRGHQIIGKINNTEDWINTPEDCDVIIEFSTPESAPENILNAFKMNIPIVSGTTGLSSKLNELIELAKDKGHTLFYASNFSLGVNIFFEINKKLASYLKQHEEYSVNIHETHHIHKKDAPSGTAITIAEGIISESDKYKGWSLNENITDKITVMSERIGEVPGTHLVEWVSENETIEIKHTAHNRRGFALGAVIAAEWLIGKRGVFNMKDLLSID